MRYPFTRCVTILADLADLADLVYLIMTYLDGHVLSLSLLFISDSTLMDGFIHVLDKITIVPLKDRVLYRCRDNGVRCYSMMYLQEATQDTTWL